jgi:hypothetical protein
VYYDNPAGRLHRVVTGFCRNSAQSQTIPVAWRSALGMPDSESPRYLRRLAVVFALPDEIEAELRKIGPDEYDRDMAVPARPCGLSRPFAVCPGQGWCASPRM